MATDTWAKLKALPISEKILLAQMYPRERLPSGWASQGIVDACETADWTESLAGVSEVVNTVDQIQGGGCLNFGKDGSNIEAKYTKSFIINGAGKYLYGHFYFEDTTDLRNASCFRIVMDAPDSANRFVRFFDRAELTNGWDNKMGGIMSASYWTFVGSPDASDITTIDIRYRTTNAADTIAIGRLKMDLWYLSDFELTNDVIVYSRPLTTYHYGDVSAILKDGVESTERTNIEDLDQATAADYHFDQSGQTLYVNELIANVPSDFKYLAEHYLLFSDNADMIDIEGATAEPRIKAIPDLNLDSAGLIWGVSFPDDGRLLIDNSDSDLDDLYDRITWVGTVVKIWIGGESLPFNEYTQIMQGQLVSGVTWKSESLSFKVTDTRFRMKGRFDYAPKYDLAVWPSVDRRYADKPVPVIYGFVEMIPMVQINKHYTLRQSINAAKLAVKIDGDFNYLGTGRGLIGSEIIQWTSESSGNLSGITRGAQDTTAKPHIAGDAFNYFRAIGASSFGPMFVNLAVDHYINFEDTFDFNVPIFIDQDIIKEGKIFWRNSLSAGGSSGRYQQYVEGPNEEHIRIGNAFDVFENARLFMGWTARYDGVSAVMDNYIDALEEILIDLLGYDAGDLDASSFTTARAKADGKISLYIGPESKIEEIIDGVLLGTLARLTVTAAGKIAVKVWEPLIDSNLDTITDEQLTARPVVKKDYKDTYGKVILRYGRKYDKKFNDDDAWKEVRVDNRNLDSIFTTLDNMDVTAFEGSDRFATNLAQRIRWLTEDKTERVTIQLEGLEHADKRPGDQIILNLARPAGYDNRVFEIEAINVKLMGRVSVTMDLVDLYGIQGKCGKVTDDAANDWSSATTDEKNENMFVSDDDGFLVPGDDTTRNIKGIW